MLYMRHTLLNTRTLQNISHAKRLALNASQGALSGGGRAIIRVELADNPYWYVEDLLGDPAEPL